jgi:diguanylate cyclase (GGDEF)-like protein
MAGAPAPAPVQSPSPEITDSVAPPELALAGPPRIIDVLHVEDGDTQALLVDRMLDASLPAIFTLERVATLRAARARLERRMPSCVLLDLRLPDADGLEALVGVRETAPDVPVVVLSGSPDEGLAVRTVQEGAQDFVTKEGADGQRIGRSMLYAIERKRVERELEHHALHDALTGLPNRTLFLDRTQHALARLRRKGGNCAVLFIDADRFKVVNDALGHEAGDRLLVELGERLTAALRPGDTVARLGGDEFTALCEELTATEEAVGIAQRVLKALETPFNIDGQEAFLSVSVGIAVAGADGDAQGIIRDADIAMYRAKERGSGLEVFSDALRRTAVDRLSLDTELHRALERGEFKVHYQPQVNCANGRISGVEALVRWARPDGELVTAAHFIDEVERAGLTGQLGALVLDQACRDVAGWSGPGDNVGVSVNVSPRQLRDPGLEQVVGDALEKAELDAGRLCLEVTERAVIEDVEQAAASLAGLRALGVHVALDDFGTGYSSLAHVTRLPVDTLKIDRTFVSGLESDPASSRVVSAVAGLAHSLGLSMVAEGVERWVQLERLLELDCPFAQGFLFSPARPAAEVSEMLGRALWRAPRGREQKLSKARRRGPKDRRPKAARNGKPAGRPAGARTVRNGKEATK